MSRKLAVCHNEKISCPKSKISKAHGHKPTVVATMDSLRTFRSASSTGSPQERPSSAASFDRSRPVTPGEFLLLALMVFFFFFFFLLCVYLDLHTHTVSPDLAKHLWSQRECWHRYKVSFLSIHCTCSWFVSRQQRQLFSRYSARAWIMECLRCVRSQL